MSCQLYERSVIFLPRSQVGVDVIVLHLRNRIVESQVQRLGEILIGHPQGTEHLLVQCLGGKTLGHGVDSLSFQATPILDARIGPDHPEHHLRILDCCEPQA